jgi:hypothetical protein
MTFVNRSTALLAGLYGLLVGGSGETYRQADAHKQQEGQGADDVVHGVGLFSLLCNPSRDWPGFEPATDDLCLWFAPRLICDGSPVRLVRLGRQDLSLRQLKTLRTVGGKAQRTCPIA